MSNPDYTIPPYMPASSVGNNGAPGMAPPPGYAPFPPYPYMPNPNGYTQPGYGYPPPQSGSWPPPWNPPQCGYNSTMPPGMAGQPTPFPPGPAPTPGTATSNLPPQFAETLNEIAEKNGLGALKEFLNWDDGDFWKGALVGAAVVALMTNEELRSSLLEGAGKATETLKAAFAGMQPTSEDASDNAEQQPQATDE